MLKLDNSHRIRTFLIIFLFFNSSDLEIFLQFYVDSLTLGSGSVDLRMFAFPDPKHSLTGNQIKEKMLFSSENLKIAWEPPLKCQMAAVLGPGMV